MGFGVYISEIAVPARVFFLDCQVLNQREFAISWGWPLVYELDIKDAGNEEAEKASTEVVDKSMMHAVIEYREEGQVKSVTAKTSPYIFKGKVRFAATPETNAVCMLYALKIKNAYSGLWHTAVLSANSTNGANSLKCD